MKNWTPTVNEDSLMLLAATTVRSLMSTMALLRATKLTKVMTSTCDVLMGPK